MRGSKVLGIVTILAGLTLVAPSRSAAADNLTAWVQRDLTALGYDTGGTDGEMTTATIVAISKFQAENDMEVTGEVTPQLAGILSARVDEGTAGSTTSTPEPLTLQQAQQACLQEKIEKARKAEAARKKRRGLGRLVRGAARVANRAGLGVGSDVARVTHDVYTANATAEDFAAAAEDLGLTPEDVEDCQNP